MRKQASNRKCLAMLVPVAVFLASGFLWASNASAAPPPNDDFVNAEVLTGLPTSTSGSNVDATLEVGEPSHGLGEAGNSVWYSWTAPATGDVEVDLNGSDFDTFLAVYTGTSLGSLSLVGQDDNSGGGLTSSLNFSATSGETYSIAVTGQSWWIPTPEGASLTVQAGSIELAIYSTSSISGTVTNDLGEPLGDVCVSVRDPLRHGVESTKTDPGGNYSVKVLAPANYTVQYRDCGYHNVFGEYYDDQQASGSADPIAVVVGADTSGIDATLTRAGALSGKVVDSSTTPIGNICVTIYDSSGVGRGVAATNVFGTYLIQYLDQGDYRLEFRECDPGRGRDFFFPSVIPEFFKDKPDLASADPVSVALGAETSGVDVELAKLGSFSGRVTNNPHGLSSQVNIAVFDRDMMLKGFGYTGSTGTYQINGLETGEYRAFFCSSISYACIGLIPLDENAADEWYQDKPDFASATPIEVTTGVNTPGVDVELGTPDQTPPLVDPPDPPADAGPSAACLAAEGDLAMANRALAKADKLRKKARMVRKDSRRLLKKARKSGKRAKVEMAKKKAFMRAKKKSRRARGKVRRARQAVLVARDVIPRVCL
ncbi:MAG: carboxypeptidase regulatory-like domain-containing protein [Thermoleophilia bacterium]|nr:carboxypeptidase regulatory-like domain-containing protein [Thermoleophilia bacterium]